MVLTQNQKSERRTISKTKMNQKKLFGKEEEKLWRAEGRERERGSAEGGLRCSEKWIENTYKKNASQTNL